MLSTTPVVSVASGRGRVVVVVVVGHPALPSFAVPDYSSPVSPSTESAGSTSGLSSLKVASLGSQAVQKLFSVPVHVATQEAVLVQV